MQRYEGKQKSRKAELQPFYGGQSPPFYPRNFVREEHTFHEYLNAKEQIEGRLSLSASLPITHPYYLCKQTQKKGNEGNMFKEGNIILFYIFTFFNSTSEGA